METQADSSGRGYAIPHFLRRWEGLGRRVMSGLAMALIVLFAVWAGSAWFMALVVLAGLQMLREWDGLTAQDPGYGWKMGGLAYVALPCVTLLWLRGIALPDVPNAGRLLVLYVIAVVAATDVAAYFVGRQIGGAKIAPSISPGKTWAGLAGGVLAAMIAGSACDSFTPYPGNFLGCMLVAALLALVAQAGDFFESWLKRRAGRKDSGALIPGHGGLLDRVDGYVFAVPVFGIIVLLGM